MTHTKAPDRNTLSPKRSLRFESLEGRALLSADLVIDLSGGPTAPSDVGPPAVVAPTDVPEGVGNLAPIDSVPNETAPLAPPSSIASTPGTGNRPSGDTTGTHIIRIQLSPELGGLIEIVLVDRDADHWKQGAFTNSDPRLEFPNRDPLLSVRSIAAIERLAADSITLESPTASLAEAVAETHEGGLIEVDPIELPDLEISERVVVVVPIEVEPILGQVHNFEVAPTTGHDPEPDAVDLPPQTLVGIHWPQRDSAEVDVAVVGGEPSVFDFSRDDADQVTTQRFVESSVIPLHPRRFEGHTTFPAESRRRLDNQDRVRSFGVPDAADHRPGPNLIEIYPQTHQAADEDRTASEDRLASSLLESTAPANQNHQEWVRPSVWLGAELGWMLDHLFGVQPSLPAENDIGVPDQDLGSERWIGEPTIVPQDDASAATSIARPTVWETGVLIVGAVIVSAGYHFALDPSRRYAAGDIPRQRRNALLNDEGDS